MADAWQVTADDLKDVATALKYEEDGLRLRRALAKELRQAVDPAVTEAKAGIMAMGSHGLSREGEPLRAAIARQVRAQALMSGKRAGVRVRVSKKGMPRGFVDAPKRTNRKGWRHPVPRRLPKGVHGPVEAPTWVTQVGAPGWFDDPMQARRSEYRRAVERVITDTAERIRRGAR